MSNLSKVSPLQVKIGDTVRYELVSENDTNQYTGTVVAICDYQSARSYADVAALHQEMVAVNPKLVDCDLLRYIVVECYDGIRRPVGYDPDGSTSWFKSNQLEIIAIGQEFSIKLYNVNSTDANLAVRILRENGFTCKVINQ